MTAQSLLCDSGGQTVMVAPQFEADSSADDLHSDLRSPLLPFPLELHSSCASPGNGIAVSPMARSASDALAPFAHRVHNALCVVFATFKIEAGDEEVRLEEVTAVVRDIQHVFGPQLKACTCVRVHWNKTAAQMLDFAREARLDRKDALFVFFLGPVANGWIVGSDGVAAPLQDLLQMFGCSSEDSPALFCALHFPLPPGKLFRDPTAAARDAVLHRSVSLFRHQAYMWLASPEGLQEFLRLLKHSGHRRDLGLIMNEFAEWTRRGGDARALRLQRTFGRLVFLCGS